MKKVCVCGHVRVFGSHCPVCGLSEEESTERIRETQERYRRRIEDDDSEE